MNSDKQEMTREELVININHYHVDIKWHYWKVQERNESKGSTYMWIFSFMEEEGHICLELLK